MRKSFGDTTDAEEISPCSPEYYYAERAYEAGRTEGLEEAATMVLTRFCCDEGEEELIAAEIRKLKGVTS